MDIQPSEIKQWILTLSAAVTMLSVATGIWLSLKEYRLKLQAERRQQASSEIEGEIKLQKLFAEMAMIANGRSGYTVSEKAVAYLLDNMQSTKGEIDLDKINRALEDLAVIRLPVGSASQDAAIAAIASLTKRHKALHAPGLRALESLANPPVSPVVSDYLNDVRQYLKEVGKNNEP